MVFGGAKAVSVIKASFDFAERDAQAQIAVRAEPMQPMFPTGVKGPPEIEKDGFTLMKSSRIQTAP